jgi:hypothetical protein
MRPLFTIHAGEYLVGLHIERRFKRYLVWVPSKDTGIDLLVTNPKSRRQASIQVKFSKDFLAPGSVPSFQRGLRACGWWTLNRSKIKNSAADLWVFVLYSFDSRDVQYVVVAPKRLLAILKGVHGNVKTYNVYLWVTTKSKCWETRGLTQAEQSLVAVDMYSNTARDFTSYLNDWTALSDKLK